MIRVYGLSHPSIITCNQGCLEFYDLFEHTITWVSTAVIELDKFFKAICRIYRQNILTITIRSLFVKGMS